MVGCHPAMPQYCTRSWWSCGWVSSSHAPVLQALSRIRIREYRSIAPPPQLALRGVRLSEALKCRDSVGPDE
jgi:hypothetical protein